MAPYHFLPHGRRRELSWRPLQHLVGNCYVLPAVVALLALWRHLRADRPADPRRAS
ncbi:MULTISPECIES: hypothetical protein [Actinopolyspora]|uniref:hypothetical protein n=1 Tax=Actinopolyspora TaxID=1849 RepID=UPI0013F5C4B3|nr:MULTISPECIES: hypothetical protein [Actinopolyspora]NHD17561.1 hypothetical protein [Actinopolyspora sp. BKK2]NHE76706.1 hypothetical protein [Actinopolyspora sp. BKK1]